MESIYELDSIARSLSSQSKKNVKAHKNELAIWKAKCSKLELEATKSRSSNVRLKEKIQELEEVVGKY